LCAVHGIPYMLGKENGGELENDAVLYQWRI
jgi:hypothetical protein